MEPANPSRPAIPSAELREQLVNMQIGPYHDRVGPIFDPIFWRHLPIEALKEITTIRAKAVQAGLKAELETITTVINVVERAKF